MEHHVNNQQFVTPARAAADQFVKDGELIGTSAAEPEGSATRNQPTLDITLPLEMHSLTNAYGERLRLTLLQTCRQCLDRGAFHSKATMLRPMGQ